MSRVVDEALVDTWSKSVDACGDPEIDAFVLLSAVYERFGRSPDQIPFAENGRIPQVSIAAIGAEPQA
jgi:hypothetical protein